MSTPGPDSDPRAADRRSDWDAQDRDVQPAVPGWSMGADWTGRLFDDTGWSIDLSNVDWGNYRSRRDERHDGDDPAYYGYDDDRQPRGGGRAGTDFGRSADVPAGWTERSAGRRGRHSRPGDELAGPADQQRGGRPDRGRYETGGQRTDRYPQDFQGGDRYPGQYAPEDQRTTQYPPDTRGPDRGGRAGRRTGRGPGGQYPPDSRRADRYPPDAQRADRYPGGYAPDQRTDRYPGQYPADTRRADRYPPDAQRADRYPGGYAPDQRTDRYTADGQRTERYPGQYPPDTQRDDWYGPAGTPHEAYSEPRTQPRRAAPPGWRPDQPPPGAGPSEWVPPGSARFEAGQYGTAQYGGYPVRTPTGQVPVVRGRPAPPGQAEGSASIVKSSGVMAVGTLGSRLTGFLRTVALAAALGGHALANSYNLANTLPNVVYNLALGGILTSVIVPLIVNAAKRDSDRGEGYDQRMFTLITIALAGITVLAMALSAPLVGLYSGSTIVGATRHLTVIFAYFFIPQIFFYGMSSLMGAILNSRGSFAAPMWTPIVNNLVVIIIFGMYYAMAGTHKTPGTISGFDVQLLGVGTTLGIIAQTAALLPALRRVGFRWRPRTDFRRAEAREIGHMAGWMFGYIAATQVAYLVSTRLAGDTGTGVSAYNYAWLLFQLPYAVVGISVITALLPRMSAHATDRRLGLVRQDFSTGVRLSAAIVVPSSLILAVLGPKLAEAVLGHGAMSPATAHYVGVVFAVFCLGLLPYMMFQLQLRVFYSLHDSKTPALIGLVTMTVNIVANLIALQALPKSDLVAGLGVGFGLANLVGAIMAWRILSTRLRGLDGWTISRSLIRMHAATVPATLAAIFVVVVIGNVYIVVVAGGGLALLIYYMFARALRIDEVTGVTRALMARVARR